MDINSSNATTSNQRPETKPIVSIQSWKTQGQKFELTAQQNIENNLNRAAHGQIGRFNTAPVDNALALRTPTQQNTYSQDPYAFKDVVDIVNPLHHIPIVGSIYRSVTGDEIKPASRIIGGSVFGGPLGAVTSTINAISEMQTGKDLNDRAFGMAGFAGAAKPVDPEMLYRRYQNTDELRTVNWGHTPQHNDDQQRYQNNHTSHLYQPVTQINLSPMPPRTLIDA